jgi:dTDP-glucose 4,6-dehydratase
MRVLVTGGAGFIGANFVHWTRRHRPEVELTVLDALTYAGSGESLGDARPLVQGDITDAALVDRLVGEHDLVVHFAPRRTTTTRCRPVAVRADQPRRAPSRSSRPSASTTCGCTTCRPTRCTATSSSTTRSGSPSPRRTTRRARTAAPRPAATCWCAPWVRSFGISATISNCSNNYGPYQHVEKFIPRQITNVLDGLRPKLYGDGLNVRDWIHVDDHNSGVWAIVDKGRSGETYLIGADGEETNRTVVEAILRELGQPEDAFDLVKDRPGHDRRYAIDSTKLRTELGWTPQYSDFAAGLRATVAWYRDNEAWWRPQKDATEAKYAKAGQ